MCSEFCAWAFLFSSSPLRGSLQCHPAIASSAPSWWRASPTLLGAFRPPFVSPSQSRDPGLGIRKPATGQPKGSTCPPGGCLAAAAQLVPSKVRRNGDLGRGGVGPPSSIFITFEPQKA